MSNVYFKGDNIFLYVQFADEQGNICPADNPKVWILQNKNNQIFEFLSKTNMQQMSENEYFYNFQIPYDADLGQYQIIYSGIINGKPANVVEVFYISFKSDKYENVIKLYGYINDIRTNCPLLDTSINIFDNQTGELFFQSLSNEDGYWEAYLYPGDYKFTFSKNEFNSLDIMAQIGDEHTEIQFNNIGLESESYTTKGNGIYQIKDKYVTKYGNPLNGLLVKIANVIQPMKVIAEDITNDDGEWQCFLDPGVYILKVNGKSLNLDFNKTFRIKIDDNGKYKFEDLSKNIANVVPSNYVDQGKGSIVVTDEVKDKTGNPIIDVQINAFKDGVTISDENIIAQDYTNVQGKWTLNLDPGNYVIEYYHPKFKAFTEKRMVK